MADVMELVERLAGLATRLQYDGSGLYGVETIAPIREVATALRAEHEARVKAEGENEQLLVRLGKEAFDRTAAEAERDRAVAAAEVVIAANASFRQAMPKDWEGDPMQDACDHLAAAIRSRKEQSP